MVRSLVRSLLETLRGERSIAGDADGDTAPDADDAVEPASDSPGDDSDGDVWDLIPVWQYDGRHVESGGVTRGEQERALRDVQLQAEAIEAREDATGAEPTEE